MANTRMSIEVHHECEGGYHRFTSPHMPGLFVSAPQDKLADAYDDLPIVIAVLIKADFGFDVKVDPLPTFEDYLRDLPDEFRPEEHLPAPRDVRVYAVERRLAA